MHIFIQNDHFIKKYYDQIKDKYNLATYVQFVQFLVNGHKNQTQELEELRKNYAKILKDYDELLGDMIDIRAIVNNKG